MDYISYFKEKKGFERFLKALMEKYESYGTFTGFIKLQNITKDEAKSFSLLLGETYKEGSDIKISIAKFNKVIAKSNFKNFDFYNLVTAYFNIPYLKTKKEIKQTKKEEYTSYIKDTLNELHNQKLINLINDSIQNNTKLGKIIKSKYQKNKFELKKDLKNYDLLLSNIPTYPTSLPLYSSITNNPHYLDFNTNTGSMFLRILFALDNESFKTTSIEKWLKLESINVYNDTLSNYVITSKLLGDKHLENFNNNLGPINLNMDNINKLNDITGINNTIFIFENPSILNYFKNEFLSIIITSGIPNLAFYNLMKKIKKGTKIYYNGDFDPEGLLIADKLKNFYPNIELFCYEEIDYDNTKASINIDQSRLKKLSNIENSNLNIITKKLLINKKAGYQENNIKSINDYIKNVMSKGV